MPDEYSARAVLSVQDKGFTSGMKSAASTVGKLEKHIGSGLKFGALSAIGGKAVSMLGSGLKSLVGGTLEVGKGFHAAMSSVSAISGATGKDLDDLTKKAKEIGANTKFTATEAANAFEYMGMAGWKAKDMLGGVDGVINAAAASGEDLATVSDIITDGLTAFGRSAKNSNRMADILASTSVNANTNIGMMGETFKYAAPVCGTFGASMEDAALASGLMANAGIKASMAGTSMREGLRRMGTGKSAAAMKKYGVQLVKTADGSVDLKGTMDSLRGAMSGLDKTEQASALSAIFGADAFSSWAAIANASEKDYNALADAIYNCDGAAEKIAQTKMDNLEGDLTLLESAVNGVQTALFETSNGPMRFIVQQATKGVGAIQKVIEGIDSETIEKKFQNFVNSIRPYWINLRNTAAEIGSAFGEAFSAVGDALSEIGGSFGSAKSVKGFKGVLEVIKSVLTSFAGFIKDHADTIATLISQLPKLAGAFLAFKGVKKIAGGIHAFATPLIALSNKGIGFIGEKLFGVAAGETAVGKASRKSTKHMLSSAKALMMMGVGILAISAGFALLAFSAVQLSKAGPLAVGVMAGLVIALSGLSLGMTAMVKSLTKATPKKLSAVTKTMLSIGAAVATIALSLAVLALAVVPLASLGTTAVAPLAAFGVVVAGLAVVFSKMGEKLKTSAVGIVAFAAAVSVMALAMAPLAATGTDGAIAMAAFGVVVAGMTAIFSVFGAGLNAATVGMIAMGAAVLLMGAGMRLATPFIQALPPLIKQIGDTASQVATALAGAVDRILTSVGNLVTVIADAVSKIVTDVGTTLCNVFTTAGEAIGGVVDSISAGIATVIDAISGGFSSVLDSIAGVIESVGNSARNAGEGFQMVAAGISMIAGLSLLDIAKSLGAVAAGIGEISISGSNLPGIGTGMLSLVTALQGVIAAQMAITLLTQLGDVAPAAAAGVTVLANAISAAIGGLLSGVAVFLSVGNACRVLAGASMVGAAAIGAISTKANAAHRALSAIGKAAGAVKSGLTSIGSAATNALGKLIGAFSNAASRASAAGKKIGTGVKDGITDSMNKLPGIAAAAMGRFNVGLSSSGSRAVATARRVASSVVSAMRSGYSSAYSAGYYIGSGLAAGMRSAVGAVRSAANQLAAEADRAIRAKAKINSPSKVTTELGGYWGQGFVNGILDTQRAVQKAAERIVFTPTLANAPEMTVGSYNGTLSEEYGYYQNGQYTIEVPLSVDGREFARATASYSQEELNRLQTRQNRKRGIL